MKIHICDICYRKHGKAKYGKWTISIKNKDRNQRIALDVCEEHKDTFKGMTFEQAEKFTTELYTQPIKRIDLIF